MKTVGAYEAKTHLPKLLERVLKGERITITKHGIPVALLQPPDPEKAVDIKSVIAELRTLRDKQLVIPAIDGETGWQLSGRNSSGCVALAWTLSYDGICTAKYL